MIDEVRLDLPVRAALPSLRAALDEHGTAVLVAPPGTGKTTLVPLALAGQVGGRVLVAEPRRVAVRAAAARMASLLGEKVGDRVGYAIRGERKPGSRVEVVTTGLLVARLQHDPELAGVDAVVLDECHERHLDTDLALAFTVDARVLRPDLRLLATSATAAADRLADALDGPVVTAPDPLHDVAVVWSPPPRPVPPPQGMRVEPALLDHVAATTRRALAEHDGDALVFLPGRREIDDVARRLSGVDAEVLPLHGGLSSAAQDVVLAGSVRGDLLAPDVSGGPRPTPRRVVLTTSIAETSLTVPGVRIVVDAGLSRQPWTDHARGLDALVTVLASRSSATQRAGRAGREAPGVAYRCWSEAEHAHRDRDDDPEVAHADLAAFALALARWGTPDAGGLALLDAPPPPAFDAARATLRGLGLVHDRATEHADRGSITSRGRAVAGVGVHPRLGRALLDGADAVGARLTAEVVALLATGGPGRSDDLEDRLRAARSGDDPGWRAEVRRLDRALREAHTRQATSGARLPDVTLATGAATVVALAYPDRLARARGADSREFLTTGGTGVELGRESGLRGQEWLAVADAARGPGDRVARVRLAVPIDEDLARTAAAHLHTDDEVVDWEDGDVVVERRERLGAIVLARRPIPKPTARALAPAVRKGLEQEGLGLLHWTDAATSLRQRLAFLHTALGAPWPAVDDASLLARADEWLDLSRVRRRADLARLTPPLTALLPWPEASRFDELAPTHVTTPDGRRVRVDYADPEKPTVALKLQHAFGWERAPELAGVPVVVHLLSPAGRPAAVTADLASFWGEGYRQVRADLRGRYPKHAWPEDPRRP
ncbi:ATP-dependent helicase HrpB [Actinomycetospora corticicola]|uniref:ATP-dependent helicase HrpB n=1 Tax=Actinomycetospora corticicola TaxID=663602 RepID=A0A7Y9E213_9PSEU|nr:ATP-dependent helicase HrpB [Actinomycetospora corticicola]